MTFERIFRRIALGTMLVLAAAVAGCSDDDDVTNPPPGGGVELNITGITPGLTVSHTFTSAGTFPYHCTPHPDMKGTVRVQTGGADSSTVEIVSSTTGGFQPDTVTVRPGGTVFWVNSTGLTHTVTSD